MKDYNHDNYELLDDEALLDEQGVSSNSKGKKRFFSLIAILLVLSFCAVYFLPLKTAKVDAPVVAQEKTVLPGTFVEADDVDTKLQLKKLEYIFNYIKDNYYEEKTDAELLEAMYTGLLENLGSPYSFYLTPEMNEEMEEAMSGEYSGIGAMVQFMDGRFSISDIFDKSPAEKAGMQIGDVILEIDGVKTEDFKDVSEVAMKARGIAGSEVEILVFRPSTQEELSMTVVRGTITNANLKYELLEDGIGYIRIVEFNSGVCQNFIDALEDLRSQGAVSFIFDLRNNGGGYVHEVVAMLDYLLPKGLIAEARGRVDGEDFVEPWMSTRDAQVPEEWKYQILINKFSASASELFSGCLRDYGKATLIGEQSFGKGVGTVSNFLADGSAVQLTNFRYFLPKGDCIEGEGLTPDVEISLEKESAGKTISQLSKEEDVQLAEALKRAQSFYSELKKQERR